MDSITILGSGRVATALGTKLANAGRSIVIGARDVDEARSGWKGPSVEFAEHDAASEMSPIVVNATPGDTSLERLAALRGSLAGKTLVDVSNATERGADGTPGGLKYPNGSLAELLQEALPATRVVKTLNTMAFTVMVDPYCLSNPPTAFLSGNDAQAKAQAIALLGDLGWPRDWIEDLGGIVTARGPEAMFAMAPFIVGSRGFKPFALSAVG